VVPDGVAVPLTGKVVKHFEDTHDAICTVYLRSIPSCRVNAILTQ